MAFENFRPDFGDASGSGSTFPIDHDKATVNMRLKDNVMPLELAIKRELDYRMKIENLQGVRLDIKEPFVSFQVPPPTPSSSTIGKKRKALSSNHRFSHNDSGKLVCTLCHVSFSSKSALRQHRLESKHKAKLMESQKKIRQTKHKPVWCKLCRISCSDERAFTQHLAGRKHAASVHAIEAAKSIKEESEKKVSKVKWDELEWDNVA
ncbi:hypothetical protein ACHQM5_006473 [Ranunculus cassubicifolius]